MKTVVLFGAGQAGTMALRLLGPNYRVLCFVDNDANKQGNRVSGIPVLSPEEGLAAGPDAVCICALGEERAEEMRVQLDELGYTGKVLSMQPLKHFDARAATMRLLAEQIEALHVPGDVAELGVYRGSFAALISAAFPQRRIHLFDTFKGFAAHDVEVERRCGFSLAETGDFADTGVELVRGRLPDPELAVFHCGRFPDTFAPCKGVSSPAGCLGQRVASGCGQAPGVSRSSLGFLCILWLRVLSSYFSPDRRRQNLPQRLYERRHHDTVDDGFAHAEHETCREGAEDERGRVVAV